MAEHVTVTPSGYSICFEDGEPDDSGKSKRRSYTVDGEKYPSVTTVLGILDKPGLKFAAEKLAVQGAIELARDGELPLQVDGALSRMKARDLRFFQVWNKKADRGTLAHDDLLGIVQGETPADLDTFAPEDQGIIRGLSDFYATERPEVGETEVMVASIAHGFAGRHDYFGSLPRRHESASCLLEVKTTEKLPRYKNGEVKPPYPEHLLQLGGYHLARDDSGYETPDYHAVLRVDSTGAWDLYTTILDPSAFIAVLGAYKALKGGVPKHREMVA